MYNACNINLYKLDKFYKEQFSSIEKDRLEKKLSHEDYFRQRLKKFNISSISEIKKAKSKDDGIDFIIKYDEEIFICQLKYWLNPLGKKIIKEIFGNMYLSDIALTYRNKNINIKYLLICPFVSESCKEKIKQYSNENYHIIYENKFVEILLNPINFMSKKMYEMRN